MNEKVFFDIVRSSLFRGSISQSQVDGIKRLLKECAARLSFRDEVAYVLATSFHETGERMQPVRETFATSDAQAITRLEGSWKAGRLKWVKTPYWRRDADGKSWFGRGDVQLTHKANYEHFRPLVLKLFGVDIVADPDAVLDPAISAFILVEGMTRGMTGRGDFTGKAIEDYLDGPKEDFVGARRVVNGIDRNTLIAGYAKKFLAALNAAEWYPPNEPVEPVIKPDVTPSPPSAEPAASEKPEPVDKPVVDGPSVWEDFLAFVNTLIVKIRGY